MWEWPALVTPFLLPISFLWDVFAYLRLQLRCGNDGHGHYHHQTKHRYIVINRCDYQTRERCIKLWTQDRGGKNTGAGVSREFTTFIL